MGKDQLFRFIYRVSNTLNQMKSGDEFDVLKLVTEPNREVFIKAACMWMDLDKLNEFSFNNEYTKIYRNDPYTPPQKRILERKTEAGPAGKFWESNGGRALQNNQ